jgi:hypothetical protein
MPILAIYFKSMIDVDLYTIPSDVRYDYSLLNTHIITS